MAGPLAEGATNTTMRTVPPRLNDVPSPTGGLPNGDHAAAAASPRGCPPVAGGAVAMRDLPAALSELLGKREKTGPTASSPA
jgi:hypothetical protein